jgi:hypothetical protein
MESKKRFEAERKKREEKDKEKRKEAEVWERANERLKNFGKRLERKSFLQRNIKMRPHRN